MNTISSLKEQGISFKTFLNRTFLMMSLGLLVSTFVAAVMSNYVYAILYNLGMLGVILPILLLVGEFAIVITLSSKIYRLSKKATYLCFFGYAIINGLSLATIFNVYSNASIALAFGAATVLFICMSIIGHNSKVDFTKYNSLISVGLISIIIVSLINIFIKSSFINWITCCVGIVLFLFLVAYDMQKLRYLYNDSFANPEIEEKLIVYGALELYLDFINLFLRILQIFGRRRD